MERIYYDYRHISKPICRPAALLGLNPFRLFRSLPLRQTAAIPSRAANAWGLRAEVYVRSVDRSQQRRQHGTVAFDACPLAECGLLQILGPLG